MNGPVPRRRKRHGPAARRACTPQVRDRSGASDAAELFLIPVPEVVDLTHKSIQVVRQIGNGKPVTGATEFRANVDVVLVSGKAKVQTLCGITVVYRALFLYGETRAALWAERVDELFSAGLERQEAEKLCVTSPEGVEKNESARVFRVNLDSD